MTFNRTEKRAEKAHRRSRRIPLIWRYFAIVVFVAGTAWFGGLVWFSASLPRGIDDPYTVTDGIVVLTGGTERIETGVLLLEARRARKLLLSGAGVGWHRDGIEEISGRIPELFSCCIVIDHEAKDTVGNATATAKWVHKEGYKSIRVVTANYHMPRSLIELGYAIPRIQLIPHPVMPGHVHLDNWWLWPGTASLLAREYSKFLVSFFRAELRLTFENTKS